MDVLRPALTLAAAASLSVSLSAQAPDKLLGEVRQALGGQAALDAVRTLSARGEENRSIGGRVKSLPFELFVMLPDHYLTVARDVQPGPVNVDITYFDGFRGDELIRRVDANIPFPPDPVPATPDGAAQQRRSMTLSQKHKFARLALVLFGRSFDGYPLEFTHAGPASCDGRPCEVIEGRHTTGATIRMFVDAASKLPVMLSWQAPPVVVFTVTSTSTVAESPRGTQVTRETAPAAPPPVPTPGAPVEHRVIVSDYKTERGVHWPRRLKYVVGSDVIEEIRFRSFSINPTLKTSRFDVGR